MGLYMGKYLVSKKRMIGIILPVLILAVCIVVLLLAYEKPLKRTGDKEFTSGSGITIGQISDLQQESLYKLCKVWGYAKYHHPSVVDGSLNWDAELFRVMPKVLEAQTEGEADRTMYLWLDQFPFEAEKTEEAAQWLALQEEAGFQKLDTSWIQDADVYGTELCGYLEKLSQTFLTEREKAYAAFLKDTPYVNFDHEVAWDLKPEDDGMKLLSLFRFWNIYEYYSPNVRITPTEWDLVLQEAIPKLLSADSYREYVLAVAAVAAETGDAHITVADKENICRFFYGRYFLPCSIKVVDGRVVVAQAAAGEQAGEGGLQAGDIIEAVDGQTIEARITELSQYTALPEPDRFLVKLGMQLLESENKQAEVRMKREDEILTLQINTMENPYRYQNPYKNGLIGQGEIGYIDPSGLKEGDLEKLMEEFTDTRGIIVDLRYYPSVFIPYLLGEYITPEPRQFAALTFPNRVSPGSFFRSDEFYSGAGAVKMAEGRETACPPYHGKVMVLMNEESMSQSEFTVMALRQSPNAVVVGSTSIGADGNVVKVSLPGRITMNISGLGVYTPDGGQTQRTGLRPDVECLPTVDGLREGRDELIEKAVELIRE